jgi:pyruvate/2-oxoglutarate dehydrogenase complex dihydrolipoamide dehydrogenase (E3) component
VAELERLGVDVRLNSFAEADDVLAERPDAVIIATGGLPDLDWFDGAEHCRSVWDVLAGDAQAKDSAIVYDGTGRHAGVSCALHMAEQGWRVQFVTIDDNMGVEMPYPDRVIYRKRFVQNEVRITTDNVLVRVQRDGNQLLATFRHELTGGEMQLRASQVIVEHGTVPVDDLYHALRARSLNDGVTDIDALLAGRPQLSKPASEGGFELHRIGDAVTSRDVHSAMYDALRLCMAL